MVRPPFIEIRLASLPDLPKLAPLFDAYRVFYGRASDLPLARAFLMDRIVHDQSVSFVAERADGELVGFVQLYPSFSSVSAARIFVLNDLYVAPAARRTGVASRLLEAAATHARSTGAVRMSLSTAVDNHAAQALYARHGWVRDDAFYSYDLALTS